MPHLQLLSLSDNDLSGVIPGEALGSLKNLHYLYLDANHLVGPLPGNLAQVGRAKLLELWVQDNALSGTVPASFIRFDQLHDFYIDGNKLTGALPPDVCGPDINADFFENVPKDVQRNYCDSIACPAGSVALEGIYPCTTCPGGEVARLKNRYLGQAGTCSEYTEREILKLFYEAATKGGPWKGVNDWKDDDRPVCAMTGITCDAHDHVVSIELKDRGLQGHITHRIGLLSYLETLDVSDNALMGYVPSDLQWTSIAKLDVSGNKIRGAIPPLLCKMAELNGNGKENVFHCDRVACPAGTYNSYGFHHGVEGEACTPCDSDSPFVGQKMCAQTTPNIFQVSQTTKVVMDNLQQMGTSSKVGIGMLIGGLVMSVVVCWLVKKASGSSYVPQRKKYRPLTMKHKTSDILHQSFNEEVESSDEYDDYSFRDYRQNSLTQDDDGSSEDSSLERSWTKRRSAVDFIKENQGIALNRRERLRKSVSKRIPSDFDRRARGAASNINIGARRRWHSHSQHTFVRAHSDVL